MLNYDVLLEASRQLHELKSRVRLNCSLVTNGSLLSPERSAELSQYIRQVQVCMDGLPQDHDIRRPYRDGRASFEDIMANMPACLSNFRRVTLSVGTDDESVDRLPGFLDMFASRVPSRENLAVVFRWIFSSQHEIEQGRNIALLDTDKVGKLLQLHRKAASLGFLVTKDFIEGPCMYPMSGGMVIDEKLNVYKCPGMIYQRACGAIRDGRIDGKNNNWYEGVTWAPSCADTCKYGPICYGGCRWKLNAHGGGCPKRQHEMNLAERVKMYMSLRYCGGVEENRCLK